MSTVEYSDVSLVHLIECGAITIRDINTMGEHKFRILIAGSKDVPTDLTKDSACEFIQGGSYIRALLKDGKLTPDHIREMSCNKLIALSLTDIYKALLRGKLSISDIITMGDDGIDSMLERYNINCEKIVNSAIDKEGIDRIDSFIAASKTGQSNGIDDLTPGKLLVLRQISEEDSTNANSYNDILGMNDYSAALFNLSHDVNPEHQYIY